MLINLGGLLDLADSISCNGLHFFSFLSAGPLIGRVCLHLIIFAPKFDGLLVCQLASVYDIYRHLEIMYLVLSVISTCQQSGYCTRCGKDNRPRVGPPSQSTTLQAPPTQGLNVDVDMGALLMDISNKITCIDDKMNSLANSLDNCVQEIMHLKTTMTQLNNRVETVDVKQNGIAARCDALDNRLSAIESSSIHPVVANTDVASSISEVTRRLYRIERRAKQSRLGVGCNGAA